MPGLAGEGEEQGLPPGAAGSCGESRAEECLIHVLKDARRSECGGWTVGLARLVRWLLVNCQ